MRTTLLAQIAKRRKGLKIRSSDMPQLAGINRQQYEKIEKGGNPSLVTLDKIAEGLDSELMLIPKEKLDAVKQILKGDESPFLHSVRISSDGEVISQRVFTPDGSEVRVHSEDSVADPWVLIEEKEKRGVDD